MANPHLGSIGNFSPLRLSRRHLPLAPLFGFALALFYHRQLPPFRFTGHYSLATRLTPAKIGFVLLLDSALVRLKPQRAND